MGLRPWELARLSPEEFAGMAQGYYRRQAREYERTAWLACYMLAPWSKKKLTPEKLLGRKSIDSRKPRRIEAEE